MSTTANSTNLTDSTNVTEGNLEVRQVGIIGALVFVVVLIISIGIIVFRRRTMAARPDCVSLPFWKGFREASAERQQEHSARSPVADLSLELLGNVKSHDSENGDDPVPESHHSNAHSAERATSSQRPLVSPRKKRRLAQRRSKLPLEQEEVEERCNGNRSSVILRVSENSTPEMSMEDGEAPQAGARRRPRLSMLPYEEVKIKEILPAAQHDGPAQQAVSAQTLAAEESNSSSRPNFSAPSPDTSEPHYETIDYSDLKGSSVTAAPPSTVSGDTSREYDEPRRTALEPSGVFRARATRSPSMAVRLPFTHSGCQVSKSVSGLDLIGVPDTPILVVPNHPPLPPKPARHNPLRRCSSLGDPVGRLGPDEGLLQSVTSLLQELEAELSGPGFNARRPNLSPPPWTHGAEQPPCMSRLDASNPESIHCGYTHLAPTDICQSYSSASSLGDQAAPDPALSAPTRDDSPGPNVLSTGPLEYYADEHSCSTGPGHDTLQQAWLAPSWLVKVDYLRHHPERSLMPPPLPGEDGENGTPVVHVHSSEPSDYLVPADILAANLEAHAGSPTQANSPRFAFPLDGAQSPQVGRPETHLYAEVLDEESRPYQSIPDAFVGTGEAPARWGRHQTVTGHRRRYRPPNPNVGTSTYRLRKQEKRANIDPYFFVDAKTTSQEFFRTKP